MTAPGALAVDKKRIVAVVITPEDQAKYDAFIKKAEWVQNHYAPKGQIFVSNDPDFQRRLDAMAERLKSDPEYSDRYEAEKKYLLRCEALDLIGPHED